MIIVEGPDGAGKTTLVDQLRFHFGDMPINPRAVGSDTQPLVAIDKWVERNVAGGLQYRLYDRHRLISEPIYGSLLRPDEPAGMFSDMNWLRTMLSEFMKLEPFIVICLPPLELARQRAMLDPDNQAYFQTNYSQLYRLYYYWAAANPSAFIYDTQDDSMFQALVDQISVYVQQKGLRPDVPTTDA